MNKPLVWKTVINGVKKVATTHFGTEYRIEKMESLGGWSAYVTVPRVGGIGGGTEVLATGLTFAAARKVATDDYRRNGGR